MGGPDGRMVPWNTRIHSTNKIADLPKSRELLQHVYKSFNSQKLLDFCLLKSNQMNKGGDWVILTSVNHPACLENKDYQRLVLLPSGWFISSTSGRGGQTQVAFSAWLTKESV